MEEAPVGDVVALKHTSRLLLSGDFCDAHLYICDSERAMPTMILPVHRVILWEKTDYFSAMFRSGMKEAATIDDNVSVARIVGYSVETVKTMVEFLYTESITECKPQDFEDCLELLRLADQYNLVRLFEAISMIIIEEYLRWRSAVHLICLGYKYENTSTKLKEVCLEYMKNDYDHIRSQSNYKEAWREYGNTDLMADTLTFVHAK